MKKVFLEIAQNSQENTCASLHFSIKLPACGAFSFIKIEALAHKKETLSQVFSCEFREISKNTFLYRALLVVASDHNVHIAF